MTDRLFDDARALLDDLAGCVGALRALVGSAGAPAAAQRAARVAGNAPTVRKLLRELLAARAAEPLELTVRGTHPSGLSNQALVDILDAQGREFLRDSPSLRDHVRRACLGRWDGSVVPLRIELEEEERLATLEVVAARFAGTLRDVRIRVLSAASAAAKARAGYGGRPVGVREGDLRDAMPRNLRVRRRGAARR